MASQGSQLSLFSASYLADSQQQQGFSIRESQTTQFNSSQASLMSQPLKMSLEPLKHTKDKIMDTNAHRKYRKLDKETVFDTSRHFFKAYREAPPLFPEKAKKAAPPQQNFSSAVCELSSVVDNFSQKLEGLGDVHQLRSSMDKLASTNPDIEKEVLSKLNELSEQLKIQARMSALILEGHNNLLIQEEKNSRTISCQTEELEQPGQGHLISSDASKEATMDTQQFTDMLSNITSVTSQEFNDCVMKSPVKPGHVILGHTSGEGTSYPKAVPTENIKSILPATPSDTRRSGQPGQVRYQLRSAGFCNKLACTMKSEDVRLQNKKSHDRTYSERTQNPKNAIRSYDRIQAKPRRSPRGHEKSKKSHKVVSTKRPRILSPNYMTPSGKRKGKTTPHHSYSRSTYELKREEKFVRWDPEVERSSYGKRTSRSRSNSHQRLCTRTEFGGGQRHVTLEDGPPNMGRKAKRCLLKSPPPKTSVHGTIRSPACKRTKEKARNSSRHGERTQKHDQICPRDHLICTRDLDQGYVRKIGTTSREALSPEESSSSIVSLSDLTGLFDEA